MPRYSTVKGKRYGPYPTSTTGVNIRTRTKDALLVPALTRRRELPGQHDLSQGAFLDEMIHFYVQHHYPDIMSGYLLDRAKAQAVTTADETGA
jgi:hypothetical protein